MSIQGNIQTFYLSSLLQLLSNDKKTGVLRVTNGSDTIEIYLSEGTIVFASSNLEEERLGNFLVHQGLVEKSIIDNSLTAARLSGKKIGDVLIESKHIAPEALSQAVFQQIEFMIYNLFLWEQGEFEYEDCSIKLPENASTEFDTMELILEASRRIDEIAVMKKHLPGPNEVLSIMPGIDTQALNLTSHEQPVLSLINNRRTVSDIINCSGYDDFSVYRVLYSLMSAGIVASSGQFTGRVPAFTFSEKNTVSSASIGPAVPNKDQPAQSYPAPEPSEAANFDIAEAASSARQRSTFFWRRPKITIGIGLALCLIGAAGAVYVLMPKISPVIESENTSAHDPASLPVRTAPPAEAEQPGVDTSERAVLPAQPRQQAHESPEASSLHAEEPSFLSLGVFTSPDELISIMLPSSYTIIDKSAAGIQRYFFTFNQNVRLTLHAQPWRGPWDPENEMFRRILDIKNSGGTSQIHTIDSYSLISVGGARGFEIAYTNDTASLPYKVHTYALVQKNTAVFLDVFYTNFRNSRIRNLVSELHKLIVTTLVIFA